MKFIKSGEKKFISDGAVYNHWTGLDWIQDDVIDNNIIGFTCTQDLKFLILLSNLLLSNLSR